MYHPYIANCAVAIYLIFTIRWRWLFWFDQKCRSISNGNMLKHAFLLLVLFKVKGNAVFFIT